MKRYITLTVALAACLILLAACGKPQQPPSLNTYESQVKSAGKGNASSGIKIDKEKDLAPEQVTAEEYAQIVEGMTLEEVQKIIGNGDADVGKPIKNKSTAGGSMTQYYWKGYAPMNTEVKMNFNKDDILMAKDPVKSNLPNEGKSSTAVTANPQGGTTTPAAE
jgi:hypothetical protein